jgi:bacterial leucyl aminopeptidase
MSPWRTFGLCLLLSACVPTDEDTASLLDACAKEQASPHSGFKIPAVVEPTLMLDSLDQVNQSRLDADVNLISTQYTNRYYNSIIGRDAALWLKNMWDNLTSQQNYAAATTFTHSNFLQPSVVATLTGASKPDEIIIIGGHFDSICHGINCLNSGIMQAPGANDNASGIAVINEVLRIWLTELSQPERTIQFMAYAGEEAGLLGSKDIATSYRLQNHNVVAVLQLDMTSGGQIDNEIYFVNDHVDQQLTNYVTRLIDHYQDVLDITYDLVTCHYACSDHASWTQQNYASVFPIDHHITDDPFNNIHTRQDTFSNLASTTKMSKFAKLGLIFTQELSQAKLDDDTECPP